ncbi:MAG TPA: hypothetical protein VKG68_04690 [Candidatus Binatus sp.]|nr:hypothetical protein [Candidatus Binatus sp.]
MRLVKLIGPAMLTAAVAMFATHANAQTMGEYATTTAATSSGASSMGTSIGSAVGNVSNDAGGSSTWGASSLGESFEERAGGASGFGAGNFDSRAGAQSGGSDAQSRWPASALNDNSSNDRFSDSSGGSDSRFGTSDRFTERTELGGTEDRFPGTGFSDTGGGMDTTYDRTGLDSSGSTSGLESTASAISGNN